MPPPSIETLIKPLETGRRFLQKMLTASHEKFSSGNITEIFIAELKNGPCHLG